jgi:hypothetical protein
MHPMSLDGRASRINIIPLTKNSPENMIGLAVYRITIEIPYSVSENENEFSNTA